MRSMTKRLPRKLKKKYASRGLRYIKRWNILIVVNDGVPTRGDSWQSKYVCGIDAYDENSNSKSMGASL